MDAQNPYPPLFCDHKMTTPLFNVITKRVSLFICDHKIGTYPKPIPLDIASILSPGKLSFSLVALYRWIYEWHNRLAQTISAGIYSAQSRCNGVYSVESAFPYPATLKSITPKTYLSDIQTILWYSAISFWL
jgi:hypothetical protein